MLLRKMMMAKTSASPVDVTGYVADTTIGYPLRGGVFEITGGVAPYSLSGSPYSGTRPAGVSVAIVGDELQMTGNTTTLASYSWTERVLSTDGQHFDVVCAVQVRAAWTPANLATPPSIWLNDTSSVTNVSGACSQWSDISGNGYNFVQITAGNRPAITASAQNGLRGLTFDGTNDQMVTNAGSATRGIFTNVAAGWMMYVGRKSGSDGAGTIRFAVHVPSGASAGTQRAALMMGSTGVANAPYAIGRRLDADGNTAVSNAGGARTDWLTSIGTMDYANRTLTLYVDGTQAGQSTTMSASGGNTSNTQSFTELVLSGNNPASPVAGACDMVLGEVIIGGGYLPTGTEVEKLAAWAAWKWALTANLEPTNPWHDIPPYV